MFSSFGGFQPSGVHSLDASGNPRIDWQIWKRRIMGSDESRFTVRRYNQVLVTGLYESDCACVKAMLTAANRITADFAHCRNVTAPQFWEDWRLTFGSLLEAHDSRAKWEPTIKSPVGT